MPRILLIEDEDSIRHLISYDLKNAGFDVTGCPDGASAREKGLNESFDIMIIDWMLPEISGIELVRLFRGKGIDSVMMMLTAKDEEEDILEAFEAGVDDYACQTDCQDKPAGAGNGRLDDGSGKPGSVGQRSAGQPDEKGI